jgi:perosamine synthetase
LSDIESARMASEPGSPRQGTTIPLSTPVLRGNEWAYVKECLDTNWVSSAGPFVDRFEKMAAGRVGMRHAVALVNGTSALHLALLVIGVQPDDEVVMPALTFIAPANAVRYLGAWPVFVDVDPHCWQLDPQRLVDFVERDCAWRKGVLRNRATGRRVRAVLPVDILGHPCDLDPIVEVAHGRDLVVVEDATEALGAHYKGRPIGGGADVACLSFNGNKIVTSGGGGMLATNHAGWADRARYLSTQAKDDPVEYIHGSVGYNYRLTNIQAALGVAQLEQLDEFVAAKRRHALEYMTALDDVAGITPMPEASWAFSTFWLYTVLVDPAQYGTDSRALLSRLAGQGIQSRPLWQPLSRSAALRDCQATSTPVADRLAAMALSLPSSADLAPADQARVVFAVKSRA